MKHLLITLLIITLMTATITTMTPMTTRARATQGTEIDWVDVARDVLIDGELSVGTQVLSSGAPAAIVVLSPQLDRALLLKIDEKTVQTLAKEAFKFSQNRSAATSQSDAAATTIGKFTRVDGVNSSYVYSFAVGGRTVVVRAHIGLTGEVSESRVWETVPAWRGSLDQYTPDAGIVAQLKTAEPETSVTILFGTWCGDSKHYVPQLLKALHAANNPRLKVKLIGVDNQFSQPLDVVQPRKLINVPTIIVERGGREIGRIIETPATDSMEEDLAAILHDKPLTHLGRVDKGPRLASGVYAYRDAAGKELGKEEWQLYGTPDGGSLIRSVITTGEQTMEVFHQLNAKKNPTFVEVTKHSGNNVTRTRYNISDRQLTATMRGNTSGTVKQTLEIPRQIAVLSPSVAAAGWLCAQTPSGDILTYVVPREFVNATGTLARSSNTMKSDETVKTPAGEYRARHLVSIFGAELSDWWLHAQLGVPVRGKLANGNEYVLTVLEIAK